MSFHRLIAPVCMLVCVGCADTNGVYGGFSLSSQLFLEDSDNDSESGGALVWLTDAEITCDELSDAWEEMVRFGDDDDLNDLMTEANGVLFALVYYAEDDALDSKSDAWKGTFTGTGSQQIEGDTVVRGATALWFEETGTFTENDSSLVISGTAFDSGILSADYWHTWDSASFTTEDCGSEDL